MKSRYGKDDNNNLSLYEWKNKCKSFGCNVPMHPFLNNLLLNVSSPFSDFPAWISPLLFLSLNTHFSLHMYLFWTSDLPGFSKRNNSVQSSSLFMGGIFWQGMNKKKNAWIRVQSVTHELTFKNVSYHLSLQSIVRIN